MKRYVMCGVNASVSERQRFVAGSRVVPREKYYY